MYVYCDLINFFIMILCDSYGEGCLCLVMDLFGILVDYL